MGEKVWIAQEFAELFRTSRLSRFQDFMVLEGSILRELPDRTNLRVTLSHLGRSVRFFMKKHRPSGFWKRFWEFFRGEAWRSPGRREGEMILAFQRHGIPTMTCAAWGEEGDRSGRSFVITREVDGIPLDDFVRRNWGRLDRNERNELIGTLAGLVSKLHAARFFHRDLYLCHVFLQDQGAMVLLDLQRVGQGKRVRSRWFVKDIAALNASSGSCVNRMDRLRFFKAYRGVERLGKKDVRFLGRVLRKTKKILRHVPRTRVRTPSNPGIKKEQES